jgi:hypothetical protein
MANKKYCECAIYMGDGKGKCLMCGKPMKPIHSTNRRKANK